MSTALYAIAAVATVAGAMYYFGVDLRSLNPFNTQTEPASVVAPETGVPPATANTPVQEPTSTEATGVAAAQSTVTASGQQQAIEGYPVNPELKRPMTSAGPPREEDWVGQYQYPNAKLNYNQLTVQIQPNPEDGQWPSELQPRAGGEVGDNIKWLNV